MQTKSHQRFIARIADYEADLELASVLISRFISGTADSAQTIAVAIGAAPTTHMKLNSRVNSRKSRQIVGRHLSKTLYGSFVKDLYEDFGEFIRSTLAVAALAGVDPGKFVGDSKVEMKTIDLLATGSWEALVRTISDQLFRSLENERSTVKLVEKFNVKLGLQLQTTIIDAAMPYLDARHMVVHQDGHADASYRSKYPTIVMIDEDKIKLDFSFANDARANICGLASHIDAKIQEKGLCRTGDLVP